MIIKTGENHLVHVPIEDLMEFITNKCLEMNTISASENFELNEITYDKKEGYIYFNVDLFKRMDA